MLQIPVVLQRRVRTEQTVQKPEMPQRSSWSGRSRARCYAATVAWGWTVPKTVEVPQLPLVQFLVVIDTPVVFVTTGACAGPDSAENVKIPHAFLDMVHCPSLCTDRSWIVETVQKTVDYQQLVPLLDKVVDVPLLATSWGSEGSAVAVHRLVCQLIKAMMSS